MVEMNAAATPSGHGRKVSYAVSLLSLLSLAACGGDEPAAGGSASVPTVFNPFTAGHTCATPGLSGSAEQQACFAEAQAQCPEDEPPGRTEFEQQPDGQYLITGYVCG